MFTRSDRWSTSRRNPSENKTNKNISLMSLSDDIRGNIDDLRVKPSADCCHNKRAFSRLFGLHWIRIEVAHLLALQTCCRRRISSCRRRFYCPCTSDTIPESLVRSSPRCRRRRRLTRWLAFWQPEWALRDSNSLQGGRSWHPLSRFADICHSGCWRIHRTPSDNRMSSWWNKNVIVFLVWLAAVVRDLFRKLTRVMSFGLEALWLRGNV